MNEIISVGYGGLGVVPRIEAAPVRDVGVLLPQGGGDPSNEDTVEISGLGRALAEAGRRSSLRVAKAAAIKAAIADGTYETPERIYGTVDRLMAVLTRGLA